MAIKQYETLISILNRSLYFFENPDDFSKCNSITVFDAQKLICGKTITNFKNKTNNNSKKIFQNLTSNNQQKRLKYVSRVATNANSLNICTLLRIINPVLDPILKWLETNNPEIDSMADIFKILKHLKFKLTFKKIYETLKEFNLNLNNRNIGQFGIALQILNSFLFYSNIFDNIIDYYYLRSKLFIKTNLYLNGLGIEDKLLYGNINKTEYNVFDILFSIYKNIYLRNNKLEHISSEFVSEPYLNTNLFFEGNPLKFDTNLININSKLIPIISESTIDQMNKDSIQLQSLYNIQFLEHVNELIKTSQSKTKSQSIESQNGGYIVNEHRKSHRKSHRKLHITKKNKY